jgi:hypothetical protein
MGSAWSVLTSFHGVSISGNLAIGFIRSQMRPDDCLPDYCLFLLLTGTHLVNPRLMGRMR